MIEVMIAMAVMAVALTAAAGNIVSLNQAHTAQREEAAVQVIANQLIERIMGANFAQLGQAIPVNLQADQNAWSWQRRATPLPATIAVAYNQFDAMGAALATPLNPPLGEYGAAPQFATQDLVQLGIESQLSGISNLRVYVEYYSMNIMNDMLAYQNAAILSPGTALTQRTAWLAEVGNNFVTDPTTASFPAACFPTPFNGTNIYFPECSVTGTVATQINLQQPAVPTTSQNDAILVRILVFWVSAAQGQRWHEVCVVRRS
jgi:type II secretory pathway pseudopilin PulG